MIKHLYVHIPFCKHICSYCSFAKSIVNEKMMYQYIDALFKELDQYDLHDLSTIYVGGGTPTSLNEELLEKLLKRLSSYLADDYEFSIELNPETMNDNKINLLKKYKINRISIGVQSFDPNILKYLNRYHTKEMVFDVVNKLHNIGLDNIRCDLLYGIKNQTKDIIENDIKLFKELKVKHISTYCLEINKGTMLYNNKEEGLDDDETVDQYHLICSLLKDFNHYEISNFGLKGYESKHNLCYWTNKEYLGVGLSSSSYVNNFRYHNTFNLSKYINGDYAHYEESEILGNEYEFEYIMLHLRLNKGISLKEYKEKFNKDFLIAYQKELQELNKYFIIDESIRIKEEYYLLQNDILSTLLLSLDY